MSLLDDGSIAEIVFDATSDLLMYDVTLHKRAEGFDADGVPNGAFTPYTLRGFIGAFSAFRRSTEAIPDSDVQVTLLQHAAPAAPETGDEITASGSRFVLLSVQRDPASATWDVHARPAA